MNKQFSADRDQRERRRRQPMIPRGVERDRLGRLCRKVGLHKLRPIHRNSDGSRHTARVARPAAETVSGIRRGGYGDDRAGCVGAAGGDGAVPAFHDIVEKD